MTKKTDPVTEFNSHILLSSEMLARERSGGGYDIRRYFSQKPGLTYGHDRYVKANHPPLTMCVAAVSEIIIEALNIYAARTGDYTPFQKLPMRSWNEGSRKDIRAYIFQFEGIGCHGTADALQKFGIGKELPFEQLKPGDFITMNRTTGSGHTAVFMGYLNEAYDEEPSYSDKVVGFRYFSAQGKGKPDAGFAHRWAFFSPRCPDVVQGKPRDCNIVLSHKQSMLNTGRMLHPNSWETEKALKALTSKFTDHQLGEDLTGPIPPRYDGITID